MKKYTFEELMNLDAKELEGLRKKAWDASDVMRLSTTEGRNIGPRLGAYDIRDIFTHGVCPVIIACAVCATGFLAVKYYTDKKFPNNGTEDNN
jgi:hypothetical protein